MGQLMPPRSEKVFQKLSHVAKIYSGPRGKHDQYLTVMKSIQLTFTIGLEHAIGIFKTEGERRQNNQGRAKGAGAFMHVGNADLGRCLEIIKSTRPPMTAQGTCASPERARARDHNTHKGPEAGSHIHLSGKLEQITT